MCARFMVSGLLPDVEPTWIEGAGLVVATESGFSLVQGMEVKELDIPDGARFL